MEKVQLPPAFAPDAEAYETLVPIVELLLRNGNSYSYPQKQRENSGFMGTQGGWVCFLEKPIDFDLVASAFELPTKVHLSREDGTIFDERTWVVIDGPKGSPPPPFGEDL